MTETPNEIVIQKPRTLAHALTHETHAALLNVAVTLSDNRNNGHMTVNVRRGSAGSVASTVNIVPVEYQSLVLLACVDTKMNAVSAGAPILSSHVHAPYVANVSLSPTTAVSAGHAWYVT
jgi:hypothetical protein